MSTLLTHRQEKWKIDILTEKDALVGSLPGVSSCKIDNSQGATVQSGGILTIVETPGLETMVNIQNSRIRAWIGVGEDWWPVGTYLIAAPRRQATSEGASWEVALLDKVSILNQDAVEGSYSLPAGTNVVNAVIDLIVSTGETALAVTGSTKALSEAQVWKAGTPKLSIINDLLATANYFGVSCDALGRYVIRPYTLPADRPVSYEFIEGEYAIHSPRWVREQDISNVPNKVVLVTQGSESEAALSGVATNTDPTSPYSYQNRGRWITLTDTLTEATDQGTLTAKAKRRLIDASSPSASLEIEYAYIPNLGLHDRVRFKSQGHDVTATIQKYTVVLGTNALVSSSLREVMTL